jgi:hypothetical protein
MKVACALAFALLVATTPLAGHHSFAAEYDGEKPVTISGTVAKIDWLNPHIYFYVDVKDDKGGVAQWKIDTVTVFGWQGRVNPTQAAGRSVTFADGKKLNCGPPAGTGGQ